ncbi:hypothetical protein IWZ00DRAFT_105701 [Phyllosticta capitalensis]|uniref:Secreted protein n=1 Tax=Phyllosticta capitalensis TaxID=121624 RepID=A0ABR1YDG8_9PEZI
MRKRRKLIIWGLGCLAMRESRAADLAHLARTPTLHSAVRGHHNNPPRATGETAPIGARRGVCLSFFKLLRLPGYITYPCLLPALACAAPCVEGFATCCGIFHALRCVALRQIICSLRIPTQRWLRPAQTIYSPAHQQSPAISATHESRMHDRERVIVLRRACAAGPPVCPLSSVLPGSSSNMYCSAAWLWRKKRQPVLCGPADGRVERRESQRGVLRHVACSACMHGGGDASSLA